MIASSFALACLARTSLLDDGNWVSFGGAGAYKPHKTVRMLGEDVNITFTDESIHVKVYFTFKNNGPATTVEMAFPFEDSVANSGVAVRSFKTLVDGKQVTVTKRAIPIVGRFFHDIGYDEEDKGYARPFAYVKSVGFEKGQVRHVVVEYDAEYGAAGSGWNLNEYIFRTGATWAGTIGQCSITVDWTKCDDYSRPSLEFIKQSGASIREPWTFLNCKRATIEFKNLEPDFDLDLTTIWSFWDIQVNGERLDLDNGIAGGSGPILSGDPRDPTIASFGLENLFWEGAYAGEAFIPGTVANAFGNNLNLKDRNIIIDGFGRKRVLARNPNLGEDDEYLWVVYLKDLVEALGGTFKWNAEWERIDITMPTRKSSISKPGKPKSKR